MGDGQQRAPGNTRVTPSRAIAHYADGVLYLLITLIPLVLAAAVSDVLLVIFFIAWYPGHILYFVLTQRRTGMSPGKSFVGIKVVDEQGGVPSQGALLRRSIPLLFEYLYIFSFIAMMTSPDRQRIGDRWGHTFVVKAAEGKLESGTTDRSYSCASCGEAFETEAAARAHAGRFHPEQYPDPSDGVVAGAPPS